MNFTKTKAKSAAVTLLVALFSGIGLGKLLELLTAQGDMAEKIGAIGLTVAGGLAQFTDSDIFKAIGIVAMAKGGHQAINAFITDENGNVKPDGVSQAVAKAVMPEGGLNGLNSLPQGRRYHPPMGNVQMLEPQYAQPMARGVFT